MSAPEVWMRYHAEMTNPGVSGDLLAQLRVSGFWSQHGTLWERAAEGKTR